MFAKFAKLYDIDGVQVLAYLDVSESETEGVDEHQIKVVAFSTVTAGPIVLLVDGIRPGRTWTVCDLFEKPENEKLLFDLVADYAKQIILLGKHLATACEDEGRCDYDDDDEEDDE